MRSKTDQFPPKASAKIPPKPALPQASDGRKDDPVVEKESLNNEPAPVQDSLGKPDEAQLVISGSPRTVWGI